jgi:hypothetical protein
MDLIRQSISETRAVAASVSEWIPHRERKKMNRGFHGFHGFHGWGQ